jgi:hypothetical protein
MTGFIAQDLNTIYPEAVTANGDDGIITLYPNQTPWMVDYGKLTPLIVKAIQEMELRVTGINELEVENTLRNSLVSWFGNTANGITEFIAGIVRAKDKLCIGEGSDEVCITKEELLEIKNHKDSQTSFVITPPSCTDTQTLVDNVCVDKKVVVSTVCSDAQILVDNVCTTPVVTTQTCTDSQTLIDNICVDKEVIAPITCSDTQVLVDNICEDNAPTNL